MENVAVRVNGQTPNNGTVPSRKNKFTPKRIALLVAALLVAALIAFVAWSAFRSSTGSAIDGSKYQAVFFTNGQVYFGKLRTLNGGYMKLTDIYYLQAQETQDSDNPQQTSEQGGNDVQLIKLGNEVHGPVDEMIISKDQVLFFENLKNDGKVSQSITKYKAENKK